MYITWDLLIQLRRNYLWNMSEMSDDRFKRKLGCNYILLTYILKTNDSKFSKLSNFTYVFCSVSNGISVRFLIFICFGVSGSKWCLNQAYGNCLTIIFILLTSFAICFVLYKSFAFSIFLFDYYDLLRYKAGALSKRFDMIQHFPIFIILRMSVGVFVNKSRSAFSHIHILLIYSYFSYKFLQKNDV